MRALYRVGVPGGLATGVGQRWLCARGLRLHAGLSAAPPLFVPPPERSRACGVRRFGDAPSAEIEEQLNERQQRRLDAFKRRLKDPSTRWILGGDARRQYGLSHSDLKVLVQNALFKNDPYEKHGAVMIQYMLRDVIDLAKKRLGSEEALIKHYRSYLVSRQGPPARLTRKIHGKSRLERLSFKTYWYSAPSSSTIEGRESVRQGLISNALICTAKGCVYYYTGSLAIYADLMHSAADVVNYAYRYLQLVRSALPGDIHHPYGYSPLRYITADRSFMVLGCLGCFVPLATSLPELVQILGGGVGSHSAVWTSDQLLPSTFLFLVSMVLEGVAVRTAYQEILAQAAAQTYGPSRKADSAPPVQIAGQQGFRADLRHLWSYCRDGRDVMSVATFCEAGSGVVGAAVGLCGLGASWALQTATPDICASIVMASSLGFICVFLLQRSGAALLGRTLPMARIEQIVEKLEERPTVTAVYDVKTEVLGTETVRFKAEVCFNPVGITRHILGVGRALEYSSVQPPSGDDPTRQQLQAQLAELLPKLHEGSWMDPDPMRVDSNLMYTNSLFYEALAHELKMVEKQIQDDLKDFQRVHIDLEPW